MYYSTLTKLDFHELPNIFPNNNEDPVTNPEEGSLIFNDDGQVIIPVQANIDAIEASVTVDVFSCSSCVTSISLWALFESVCSIFVHTEIKRR